MNATEMSITREMFAKQAKHRDELIAAVELALEFIEQYEDVNDGDYGEQKPNYAMSVGNQLREALGVRS